MVRIGGKGKSGEKIKLQFSLGSDLIMMYGVIRSVEFNKTLNQSRLHFECTHIAPAMRNEILTFVYKILPDEEKENNEAIELLESDIRESLENIDESVKIKEEAPSTEEVSDLEELEELEEIDEEKTGA